MGNKLKYKKGDIVYDGRGKYLGFIVKADKEPGEGNKYNKYAVETEDGTQIPLDEHQIVETSWHKEKNDELD